MLAGVLVAAIAVAVQHRRLACWLDFGPCESSAIQPLNAGRPVQVEITLREDPARAAKGSAAADSATAHALQQATPLLATPVRAAMHPPFQLALRDGDQRVMFGGNASLGLGFSTVGEMPVMTLHISDDLVHQYNCSRIAPQKKLIA
jgi:hypothetical protein